MSLLSTPQIQMQRARLTSVLLLAALLSCVSSTALGADSWEILQSPLACLTNIQLTRIGMSLDAPKTAIARSSPLLNSAYRFRIPPLLARAERSDARVLFQLYAFT
jgi:hypothetical protein